MAQRKAHEVDRFIKNPDPKFKTVLIYGPNTGLVSEHARNLARGSGVDMDDPFSLIRMDADRVASHQNHLTEEADTISMFGGKRLIWISGSTAKNMVKSIDPVLSIPPEDTLILIEAGDLRKTAPLRKQIEQAEFAIALPCFADDQKSLDRLIDQELAKAGLTIDDPARQLLRPLLGADRQASRNEVIKLCLYASGKGAISERDIEAIVGDASAFAIDEVVDAASTGDLTGVQHSLHRLFETGTHPSVVATAALRHFQGLHKAQAEMTHSGRTAQFVIMRMRPPPMFRRKAAVVSALNIWNMPALERTLQRLEQTNLESRASGQLANAITAMALLAISLDAKRQRSKR